MITKFLLERAIDMLPIASDDSTRYHLCGVHILSKAGKVTLTATDGHMLLTREYSYVKCPDGEFMLRYDEVPAIKAMLKTCKTWNEFPASTDAEGSMLIGATTRAFISKMDGEYPDYLQVIPEPCAEKVAITLNAEYILAIAKALTDGEKRAKPTVRIVFNPSDACKPVRIERESKDGFTAIIMPVRDSGSDAIAAERAAASEAREGVA